LSIFAQTRKDKENENPQIAPKRISIAIPNPIAMKEKRAIVLVRACPA